MRIRKSKKLNIGVSLLRRLTIEAGEKFPVGG